MDSFLFRYFKKAEPEDITYQDFRQFIDQGIEENQNLEYKPCGLLVYGDGSIIKPSSNKDIVGFSALAKTVAGFANAEGGLLVLGVKEKPEKYKGKVIKVRPGVIRPLPISITREVIENQLMSKIQYPAEGITIVPLRSSSRSRHLVYLIDIPQSKLAPHRVNELYYYQRYNFSTLEMKHYQIADLFGRRLAPDLDIVLQKTKGCNENIGHFSINPLIRNKGTAVAKYVTCLCKVLEGPYQIFQSMWNHRNSVCQFTTGTESVVYPEIPSNPGYIEFKPISDTRREPLVLQFKLYAESVTAKVLIIVVIPEEFLDTGNYEVIVNQRL